MTPTRFLIAVSVLAFAAPAFAQGMMKDDGMSKDGMSKSDGMSKDGMKGEKTVEVGGAPMYPSKNIVENAVNSKDHTTLVAAVKAAGLVDTLSGKGPFTVFAPTNDAFEELPKGTVDTLLKPENKKQLAGILTYHVVPGTHTAADIQAAIKKGGGKAVFKTAAGESLTASMDGDDIVVTDAKGGEAEVTIGDVMQSNGVIHVVGKVLLPS
jgi:uncharacterized surface protein with fasciclin (FAS1) repeats